MPREGISTYTRKEYTELHCRVHIKHRKEYTRLCVTARATREVRGYCRNERACWATKFYAMKWDLKSRHARLIEHQPRGNTGFLTHFPIISVWTWVIFGNLITLRQNRILRKVAELRTRAPCRKGLKRSSARLVEQKMQLSGPTTRSLASSDLGRAFILWWFCSFSLFSYSPWQSNCLRVKYKDFISCVSRRTSEYACDKLHDLQGVEGQIKPLLPYLFWTENQS